MPDPQTWALTDQYRRAQLQLVARALRDYLRLWPIWRPDDAATFPLLVTATIPLVRAYHRLAATIAAAYYQALRDAEQIPGAATPRLAALRSVEQVIASLYVTGQVMTANAASRGLSGGQARESALVRTSGAVSRHILSGARETLLDSVQADKQAVGWARVTDGDPCAFCLMLASRGAVYKSEQTAGFQAHDHCGCTVMPLWKGSKLPDQTRRWRDIYNAAQNDGEASGLLQPGSNSSEARVNAIRRYLDANPIAV